MRPGVVVLVGLPGAGKSTLAAALAERIEGARVLDKDQVRASLFAPCDYTAAERDVSFAAMLDAARYHLGRGRVVIFDGLTFSRRQQVEAAERLAVECSSFVAIVVCDVSVEVAIARCEHDRYDRTSPGRLGHLATNRDADLVRRVAAEMEEPPGAYLTVRSDEPAAEVARQAFAYISDCAA